jgi:hypothetical protein
LNALPDELNNFGFLAVMALRAVDKLGAACTGLGSQLIAPCVSSQPRDDPNAHGGGDGNGACGNPEQELS